MAINWTNVTNVGDFLQIANTNTGGVFWNSSLWFLFIIILISFSSFGFEVAILGASFISLILGIFLLYLGLVSMGWTIGSFVGILLISFLYIVFVSGKEQ